MKRLVLIAALLVAPTAYAQGELTVDVTADRASARTGERFTATFLVRSFGAPSDVLLEFGFLRATILFDVTPPPGWTCTESAIGTLLCRTQTLAAGAQTTIRATLLTPISLAEPVRGMAWIYWNIGASRFSYGDELQMPVTAAPRTADLAADAIAKEVVREGETAEIVIDAYNQGPDAAGPVFLDLWNVAEATSYRVAGGAGWTCDGRLCTRATLAAGEHAPLTLRVGTPALPINFEVGAILFGEGIHDPLPRNNYAIHELFVANAENYERVLLPATPGTIHGANGSSWVTSVTTVMFRRIDFFTLPCAIIACLNIGLPPAGAAFDPSKYSIVPADNDPRGFFLYTKRGDMSALAFNIRVQQTSGVWGTELPLAREADFRDGIVLVGVPAMFGMRHLIRIYGLDGRDTDVLIHPHDARFGGAYAPIVKRLSGSGEVITPARLPLRPAYATFDSSELRMPMVPLDLFYVIAPVTPGTKIWAYATVTHNETRQVTTITPQ